jgi:WD40 repeat protein
MSFSKHGFVLAGALFIMACNLVNLFESAPSAAPSTPTQVKPLLQATSAPNTDRPPDTQPTDQPDAERSLQVIQPENAGRLHELREVSLNNPYGLGWSADSRVIGVMTPAGLALYKTATLELLSNVEIQVPYALLDASVDDGLMALTTDQKTVELRDIRTGAARATIQSPSTFFTAVFSNDGKIIAVPLTDQVAVDLYETGTGKKVSTLTGFQITDPVYSISFAGDGTHVIWVSRASVQVMDLQTGQMGAMLTHEDYVGAVALAPDGKMLAVASSGTVNNQIQPLIQIWDAGDGKELGKISSGDFVTASLAFSPDGRLLVGGRNNTAVLWDPATLQEVKVLGGHRDRINSIRFSPDGKWVATSGADGALKLWAVAP